MNKVRASMGTLGVLGLEIIQMDTPPTTAYLQIYTEKRCNANCQFCAQAKDSSSDLTHIARGIYIPYDIGAVVSRLKMAYDRGYLARACIQTALYDSWWLDTVHLIKMIRENSNIPISLSVFPVSNECLEVFKSLNVNDVVIPLDACTPDLFNKIKGKSAGGPYSWESHMDGIKRASRIFQNVGTHLMIGLGETDEEAIKLISELWKSNVNAALFSYTYVPGTQFEIATKPGSEIIRHYRDVQLANHLIHEKLADYPDMRFENNIIRDFGVDENILFSVIEDGSAFQTSGCPECNRPMANETFSQIFNFPKKLGNDEKEKIKLELGIKK
jgi:biotin synthase